MTNITATDTTTALLQASQGQSADVIATAKNAGGTKDMQAIEEAAKDFEAMFITEMMKPMFEGIKPDPMFGGGKGEEVFQSMMLTEYGKKIAETGQLGIADQVKQEMIRLQEEANGSTTTQN